MKFNDISLSNMMNHSFKFSTICRSDNIYSLLKSFYMSLTTAPISMIKSDFTISMSGFTTKFYKTDL